MPAQRSIVICGGAFAGLALALALRQGLGGAIPVIVAEGERVVDGVGRVHEADAVCVVAGPWTDALLAPLGVKIGIKSERAQIAFLYPKMPKKS